MNTVVHLADLVGRKLEFEASMNQTRHGTIVRASYTLHCELVLVIHPQCRTGEIPANTVLIGRPAWAALEHLNPVVDAA